MPECENRGSKKCGRTSLSARDKRGCTLEDRGGVRGGIFGDGGVLEWDSKGDGGLLNGGVDGGRKVCKNTAEVGPLLETGLLPSEES